MTDSPKPGASPLLQPAQSAACRLSSSASRLSLPHPLPVTERHLRQVLKSPVWAEQRAVWRRLRPAPEDRPS